jgi:DNA-binding Lrp family transcriptional regulator
MSQPKKQVRTLHERLKIVEEVEKNPGEKLVDIAKRLGLAPSTLNSIFPKKDEIREQIEKCNASKKRKTEGVDIRRVGKCTLHVVPAGTGIKYSS